MGRPPNHRLGCCPNCGPQPVHFQVHARGPRSQRSQRVLVWNHHRDLDLRKGRLKPAPRWKKPEVLSSETWMQALEATWNEQVVQHSVYLRPQQDLQSRQCNNQQSVQAQWEDFMTCLNLCFTKAISLLLQSQSDPEVIRALQALQKQAGLSAKGRVAKHQWVSDAGLAAPNPSPGEKGRKLRRTLASWLVMRLKGCSDTAKFWTPSCFFVCLAQGKQAKRLLVIYCLL